MKLYHFPASPFVRKVMIVAHELGLADSLELVSSAPSPVARDEALGEYNPLGKIPVLVLADGTVLYDSSVIAEYLATLHGDNGILPGDGSQRWNALTRQALADGILEASQAVRFETVARPEEFRWQAWEDGHRIKILAGIDALEKAADELGWTIGDITVACALGYLDFRLPDVDWRERAPKLAGWFQDVATKASFQATRPD